jgi:hypothetical protein
MAALSETRDPILLRRTFDFSLSSEVKTQDIRTLFSVLAANPISKRELFEFFKANYETIVGRFAGEPSFVSSLGKDSRLTH